jgi:hypothetical protein
MRASRFATLILALVLIALLVNYIVVFAGAAPDVFFVKLDNLARTFGILLFPLLWLAIFLNAYLWLAIRGRFGLSKPALLSEDHKVARRAFAAAGKISTFAIIALVVSCGPLTSLQLPAAPAPGHVVFFVRLGHFVVDYGYFLIFLLWFAIFFAVSLGLSMPSSTKAPKNVADQEDWAIEP